MTTSFQDMLGGENPMKGILSAPSHAQGPDVLLRNSYRLTHADQGTIDMGGLNVVVSPEVTRGASIARK